MISLNSDKDVYQLELLTTPTGLPASGRTRYAAAMYFFVRGMIGHEALEVYRICSPLDGEDPHILLASKGLAGEVAVAFAAKSSPIQRGVTRDASREIF